jgi:ubiquinone/menaquinone biosynthesis C-methylase UbiE
MMKGSSRCKLSDESASQSSESLFERCHWLYALCRENFFRDHTREITSALFPSGDPADGTKILELGCGPGLYACRFAKDFPQVTATGIDLSKRLIRRAQTRAANLQLQNCKFFEGDAQALREPSHSADAVIVSRLFLIVPDKEAVLTEIFRVLRPGGRCFIAEPTSGFASRLPLDAMWLFARMTGTPWKKFHEPQNVEVMRPHDFVALVQGPPWASVDVLQDGWYQYAVCQKGDAQANEQSWSAA